MDNDEIIKKLENNIIRLSTGKATTIELVEDDDESETYKIKFELMDVGVYNMINFTEENLKFMVAEFKRDKNGVVSHGLDHSWDTLDQIGKVYDLQLEGQGKRTKVFALSELYKETPNQTQAHTLFRQGLLKFVSGGWFPTKYAWNDEENHIDMEKPKLREMSSTPMPAKQDAKQKEILQSLNHSPMEESDMTENDETNDKPSGEGQEVSELRDELAALKAEHVAELKSLKDERVEMATKADAEIRVGLMKRASELELSEELFKDSTNEAIELALKATKEFQVSELQKREPDYQFGGEGNVGLVDGSEEMVTLLIDEHFQWAKPPAGPKGV